MGSSSGSAVRRLAGGKEILVKAVIQAVPIYAMQCFKLPDSLCDDLSRLCAAFWWGDKEDKRRLHWSKWSALCVPKCQGGMGFRDFKSFNKALLAKQLWRILTNPELLVTRVFMVRYCRGGDLLKAKARSGCSYVWRSIIGSKDVIEKGLRWCVGSGRRVQVFEDRWVESAQIGKLRGREGRRDEQLTVAQLIRDDGSWNTELISDIFLEHEKEAILATKCRGVKAEDVRWWAFEPMGRFTVKSCYLAQLGFYDQHANMSSENRKLWSQLVWQVNVPPKTRVFMWRACRNYIPTMGNLRHHHVPVDGVCGECHDRWATTEHVLFYCPSVKEIWKKSKFWGILKRGMQMSMLDMVQVMRAEVVEEDFEVWSIMCWKVWSYVCSMAHGDREAEHKPTEEECRILWELYQRARVTVARQMKLGVECGARSWKKPVKGIYRVDVDAMFEDEQQRYGVGVVVRDWQGRVCAAATRRTHRRRNVMIAEMLAVVEGILVCMKCDLMPIHVYTDSLLTARIMTTPEDEDNLPDDVAEIINAARKVFLVGVSHMFRTANEVAHVLAQKASDYEADMMWTESFPSWLRDVVAKDLD